MTTTRCLASSLAVAFAMVISACSGSPSEPPPGMNQQCVTNCTPPASMPDLLPSPAQVMVDASLPCEKMQIPAASCSMNVGAFLYGQFRTIMAQPPGGTEVKCLAQFMPDGKVVFNFLATYARMEGDFEGKEVYGDPFKCVRQLH